MEATETPFCLTRQWATVSIGLEADLRWEPLVMEATCRGSAATVGVTAVTGIDPTKLPIEYVTGDHEATRPTVRFLVDAEVLVDGALRTLQFLSRFRVRSFGLLVFGNRLAGA
jgi:hypothetical protein